MRRREFIILLGGAIAGPATAQQQPRRLYRVGLLMGSPPAPYHDGLIDGLRDLGYIEGKNMTVERRSSGQNIERLPQLAKELVALEVDVIVAGGTPAIIAARDASDTIPVVMGTVGDPVALQLVKNLSRPGGRLTGVTNQNADLSAKRLELLKEIIPTTTRVRVLSHSGDPLSTVLLEQSFAGARTLRLELDVIDARDNAEFQAALANLDGSDPIAVLPLSFLLARRREIADSLLLKRIPAIYGFREHVVAGGLMSFGASFYDSFYRSATHVDKLLRGAKAADIPIEQPRKFELVLNQKTARALEILIPLSLVADEVIE
jgi:putative tryptophan/tyrosine transport system substrate-binding protein